jgi:hypothetical protein
MHNDQYTKTYSASSRDHQRELERQNTGGGGNGDSCRRQHGQGKVTHSNAKTHATTRLLFGVTCLRGWRVQKTKSLNMDVVNTMTLVATTHLSLLQLLCNIVLAQLAS